MTPEKPWGWMAEFADPQALLAAAREARLRGYRAQAYAPFHIEGLAAALGRRRAPIASLTFAGAVIGGVGGFFMQWYSAVIDRPLNIGGRPLDSWPMFVPVSFELAVLVAALAAVLAFVVASGLPRLRHPLFDAGDFEFATRHRFFLVLRSDDPRFAADDAARWLDSLAPLRRIEVPA